MKLTIFGTGYVGLVHAAVMAEVGHDVLCMDIDAARIGQLRQGHVSIYEPGLAELVRQNLEAGHLRFTHDVQEAVTHGQVQFIAVGTPPGDGGGADLNSVFAVADGIARHRRQPVIIVEKSTVPVGTGDRLKAYIDSLLAESGRQLEFDIVSNPEFLKEGSALSDCRRPDRIVIGSERAQVLAVMREIYEPFNRNHDRILSMNLRSAELTKYAANGMLATKISFINQIAELAENLGADIESIRQGIGADPRIGYQFIYPGCGYGGSCFPKDVSALVHLGRDQKVVLSVCEATQTANELQRRYVLEKLLALFPEGMSGKTVAVWGLAFKPETDDVRDAPAGFVVRELLQRGAIVRAHDPEAAESFARAYAPGNPAVSYHDREYDCLDGADVLLLMTEWRHFRNPDFDDIRARMRGDAIVDARNIWGVFKLGQRGWRYVAIGMR